MDPIGSKHKAPEPKVIAAVATIIAMIDNDYEDGSNGAIGICNVVDIYTEAYNAASESKGNFTDEEILNCLTDITDGATILHKGIVYLKNLEDVIVEVCLSKMCQVILKRVRSIGIRTVRDLWVNTAYTYSEIIQALIVLYFNGYVYVTIENGSTPIDGTWYAITN